MAFALMQAWEMPRKSNITKQNKKLQWATVFGLYSGLMYDFWAIQKQKVRITKKKLESANARCLYISPDVLCNTYQLCKKRVAWIEFKKANRTSVCQCGLPPMVLMHLDEPCKGKVDMTEQQNINRRYPHTNEDNMLRQVMEKNPRPCANTWYWASRVWNAAYVELQSWTPFQAMNSQLPDFAWRTLTNSHEAPSNNLFSPFKPTPKTTTTQPQKHHTKAPAQQHHHHITTATTTKTPP